MTPNKIKEDRVVRVTVSVNFETNMSFWTALKLRLAGGKAIEEYIKEHIEEMNDDA